MPTMEYSLNQDVGPSGEAPKENAAVSLCRPPSVAEETATPLTTQHEHTDSMVTIRLSEAGLPRNEETLEHEATLDESQPTIQNASTDHKGPEDGEKPQDEDLGSVSMPSIEDGEKEEDGDLCSVSVPSTEKPATIPNASTDHIGPEDGEKQEDEDLNLVSVPSTEKPQNASIDHKGSEDGEKPQDEDLGSVSMPSIEDGEKEEDGDLGSVSVPSTEKPATIRATSPIQPEDIVESPTHLSSTHALELNHDVSLPNEVSLSSRSTSTSSMDAPIASHPVTLGAELERVSLSRSLSNRSSRSEGSTNVDWEKLDKNEEQEERGEGTDESMAFLLARLEQENNALAINPKANIVAPRDRSGSRPPSFQQLKKLVSEPAKPSLRYSLLPSPPPMTELEFWTALVRNYSQTAQRLPTLTANKIRNGVPAPLRGVVWVSIAGARDAVLENEYERLSNESSPYEKLITKDIGRSFPGVDMFRDPDGEGQKMLGKVLNAFSLWDQEIGYCQGLGFVVGPLLMHMDDKDAFCVLVRLMEHYDLRSCFLPDLSGLHLRIYQFQHLLSQHLPELTAHLDKMNVEPLYLSQWFLSFFGVTCPLPMLIRIYDVILTEGASETLMRVALSLMRRNEEKILAATEFEDIMQLLLSRSLWDTYGCNADDLVQDFCDWTGLVTRENLKTLENSFKNNQSPTVTSRPSVHTAAARFLGRFWAGSTTAMSPKSPGPASLTAPGRPTSTIRRTPSKQSMASTLNSVESAESNQSSTSTEATQISRQVSGDWVPQKPTLVASMPAATKVAPNKDKGLHSQIEDLLTALSDMQREHSLLASELQHEREERDEDRLAVSRVVERIKKGKSLAAIPEDAENAGLRDAPPLSPTSDATILELENHFTPSIKRSSLSLHTKQQLREEANRWKEQYNQEVGRSMELSRQLSDREREANISKEDLREARARIQEAHREKQKLEIANRELRSRRGTLTDNYADSPISPADSITSASSKTGLREFKLCRTSTSGMKLDQTQGSPQFSKRMSSLSTQSVLATEDHRPASEDALLLELVTAKTLEAVARQELEEVKGKLDALRKLLSVNSTSPGPSTVAKAGNHNSSPSAGWGAAMLSGARSATTPAAAPVSTPPAAGFFSGWGKRTVSGDGK